MRREGRMYLLFLILTVVIGWGILTGQPLCRHECFDANQCGHCGDFVEGAQPPCLGVELCGIMDPNCRLVGWAHVKDPQQCLHAGQARDQWVTTRLFDCNGDGHPDCECKGYHSCPKDAKDVENSDIVISMSMVEQSQMPMGVRNHVASGLAKGLGAYLGAC